eukprot:2998862-Pyramimonas_sp.AAC.1
MLGDPDVPSVSRGSVGGQNRRSDTRSRSSRPYGSARRWRRTDRGRCPQWLLGVPRAFLLNAGK